MVTGKVDSYWTEKYHYTRISYGLENSDVVVYLHGYNDYFFQEELAQFFLNRGYGFLAIDLHYCGRSFVDVKHSHFVSDLRNYDNEITDTLASLALKNVHLMGHSTGGLVFLDYYNRIRPEVKSLVLNSPFLDFNIKDWKKVSLSFVTILAKWFPYQKISRRSLGYGRSIYKGNGGAWDFNITYKDLNGRPVKLGWVRAIFEAQERIKNMFLDVPSIFLLSDHTSSSEQDILLGDAVLNVDDLKNVIATFSGNIDVKAIPKALHDVFLSPPSVRTLAYDSLSKFYDAIDLSMRENTKE